MLQAQQLNVSLGRQAILHDVSFEARPGEVTALLGPNGSGRARRYRCNAAASCTRPAATCRRTAAHAAGSA